MNDMQILDYAVSLAPMTRELHIKAQQAMHNVSEQLAALERIKAEQAAQAGKAREAKRTEPEKG